MNDDHTKPAPIGALEWLRRDRAKPAPADERERFEAWTRTAPEFAPEFEVHRGWAEEFAWFAWRERAALAARTAPAGLLEWAVSRWHAEVSQRPLVNAHRRSFDDTWRQVIRFAGGDDVALCGPRHDDLLAAAQQEPRT